jgi:peptidoglycan/LPS O-acetylase OafA/YrhL
MEPTDRSRYDPRIDVLRAVAFLLVALPHFSVPTWTDGIVNRHLVIDMLPLSIIKTGWFGVPLFLFLSGYSLALGKCDPSYVLDKKQFYVNRVLRIFPVWIICILILSFTVHLPGMTVFGLLLLQTQELHAAGSFGIAWSIQLEFMCYLIYPILLIAVSRRHNILATFAFFMLVRVALYFLDTTSVFLFAYGTVFGATTIFLSGMIAASLPPLKNGIWAWGLFVAGVVAFCALAVVITAFGGYENPHGRIIHGIFLFSPEIFSTIVFVMLRGALTERNAAVPQPYSRGLLSSLRRGVFAVFVHIGKISYSGYMFSLFVLDFTGHVFTFIKPGGWHSLVPAFLLYLTVLCGFATTSYYAIELPFLGMRRRYVRSEPAAVALAQRAAE